MKKQDSPAATLFERARQFSSSDERASYLDQACQGDLALRQKIEDMLEASARAEAFFETESDPTATVNTPIAEGPGTRIGRYKLLQQIGEGGFGVVYMAEQQEPVVRKVALKIIKPGMDTKQVIARFEAERQALALLEHPCIAKVFGAGATDTGRPYFCMELVNGISITKFCDKNKTSTADRITLFIQVCRAIQYAHQKGIIHRDIKPGNVLVTLHDGKPVPKIIDFGIAKAINQRLTEKTLFTNFAQMIGTPAYMSPEQAEMSGLDIDSRTDVYSLGVLLYELLTGTTPFPEEKLRSLGYNKMQRFIVEEDPVKPSTRLSTMQQPVLTLVAENQSMDPNAIRKAFKADLDWIVMKSLDKDRSRRYESAHHLAIDLEQYLENKPVSAVAPSLLYRLQKFGTRNQLALTISSAFLIILLSATIISTWQAIIATRERGHAENAQGDAEKARSSAVASENLARLNLYAADIKLAQQALNNQLLGAAFDLLAPYQQFKGSNDVRGFEWFYLWNRCQSDEIDRLPTIEGKGKVNEILFIDQDTIIAAVDEKPQIWNLKSKKLIRILPERSDYFSHSIAYKKPLLAVLDHGGLLNRSDAIRVSFYDFQDPLNPMLANSLVIPAKNHRFDFGSIAFSPTHSHIAVGQGTWNEGEVEIWDYLTNTIITNLPASGFLSRYSPDGEFIATNGGGSAQRVTTPVSLWDATSHTKIRSFLRMEKQGLEGYWPRFTALQFFPDGSRVAAGINSTFIWPIDSPQAENFLGNDEEFQGHESFAFSPSGDLMATAGWDQTVRIWNTKTLEPIRALRGHRDQVLSVAFSPDGDQIVSGGKDGSIKLWPVEPPPKRTGEFAQVSHPPSFSLNGEMMAASETPGRVSIWNTASGVKISEIDTQLQTLAFSQDGNQLIAAPSISNRSNFSRDDQLRLEHWDISNLLHPVLSHTVTLDAVSHTGPNNESSLVHWGFHHQPGSDGLYFSELHRKPGDRKSGSAITIYDTDTGRTVFQHGTNSRDEPLLLFVLAISPTEPLIALGGYGPFRIWNLETKKELKTLHGHTDAVTHCIFFPDGKHIASSCVGATIRIWNLETGREICPTMKGHQLNAWLSVSPDGKTLVSGGLGWDSLAKLWNVQTGREVASFSIAKSMGVYPAFSPDGSTLSLWSQKNQQIHLLRSK